MRAKSSVLSRDYAPSFDWALFFFLRRLSSFKNHHLLVVHFFFSSRRHLHCRSLPEGSLPASSHQQADANTMETKSGLQLPSSSFTEMEGERGSTSPCFVWISPLPLFCGKHPLFCYTAINNSPQKAWNQNTLMTGPDYLLSSRNISDWLPVPTPMPRRGNAGYVAHAVTDPSWTINSSLTYLPWGILITPPSILELQKNIGSLATKN